jgi:hypothetical protein
MRHEAIYGRADILSVMENVPSNQLKILLQDGSGCSYSCPAKFSLAEIAIVLCVT